MSSSTRNENWMDISPPEHGPVGTLSALCAQPPKGTLMRKAH